MTSDQRWADTLAKHQAAVEAFIDALAQLSDEDWYMEPSPEKWSPAALTLHVTDAYEMGLRAWPAARACGFASLAGKPGSTAPHSPQLMRRGEFPRVRAPREIQPDLEEARRRTRVEALERLRRTAQEAGVAFRTAETALNAPRLTHAYFGALPPHLALRFLTTHTQHHTKGVLRTLSRAG